MLLVLKDNYASEILFLLLILFQHSFILIASYFSLETDIFKPRYFILLLFLP